MVTTNTTVGPHRPNSNARPPRRQQPIRKKPSKQVKQTQKRRPRQAPPIVEASVLEQSEEEAEIARIEAQAGDDEVNLEVAGMAHNEEQNRTGESQRATDQVENHGIVFNPNSDQLQRYKKLVSRTLGKPCFVDMSALEALGVREQVEQLFANVGWSNFLSLHEGIHSKEVFEFLSSVEIDKHGTGIYFRLNGAQHYASNTMISESFWFPTNAKTYFPTDWAHSHYSFWQRIACGRLDRATYFEIYDVSHSKSSLIYNLSLRIAQRIIAHTILAGDDNARNCGSRELWILQCMLEKKHFNPVCWFVTQITKSSKGTITTGGMIMVLLRRLIDLGYLHTTLPSTPASIPERYLTISMLANSKFIGKHNRIWHTLHLGRRLFVLPQPSRTDPYVEANLLPNPPPSAEFRHGEVPEELPQPEIEIPALPEIPILTPASTPVHTMEFGQGLGQRVADHTEHESTTAAHSSMNTTASTSTALPSLGAPQGLTPMEQILYRLVDQQTIFMQQLAEQREQQLETRRTVDILLQTQIALLARLEQAPAPAPVSHPLLPLQAPMPPHLQAPIQPQPLPFDPSQFLQLQDPRPDQLHPQQQQLPPHP